MSSLYFPTPGQGQIQVFEGPSPSATLSLDDFSKDPGFLASREELRSLILNNAQSALPSREVTPFGGGVEKRDSTAAKVHQIKQVLFEGRNLEYLRNYSNQVAPWVSSFIVFSRIQKYYVLPSWRPRI